MGEKHGNPDGTLLLCDNVFYPGGNLGMGATVEFTFTNEEEKALLQRMGEDFEGQDIWSVIEVFNGNDFANYVRKNNISCSKKRKPQLLGKPILFP